MITPIDLEELKGSTNALSSNGTDMLSRLIQIIEVQREGYKILKVAVNDKQPDPGAVAFIDRIQYQVAAILQGEHPLSWLGRGISIKPLTNKEGIQNANTKP